MITVAFSSKKPLGSFKQHIKETSGFKDIEIIGYENKNQFSLTELYNKALDESKNDIVILIHDDIEFNTNKWGKIIVKLFDKNPTFGIIGLAGADHLEDGIWWKNKVNTYGQVYHTNEDRSKKWLSSFSGDLGNKLQDVVAVDGVFIAVHKDRIVNKFDESYEGFHFYDIPFCFSNYLDGVDVGVTTKIKITHFSVGPISENWKISKTQFEEQFKEHLPTKVEYDIKYVDYVRKIKNPPKVDIIIPSKNNVDMLLDAVNSFYEKSRYTNYHIHIADTGSTDDNIKRLNEYKKDKNNITLHLFDYYNFAKINNEVVKKLDNPELLLFCNDDIELINDALSLMVEQYQKDDKTGIVGCRLHFEDGSIQHNGLEFYHRLKGSYYEVRNVERHRTNGYKTKNHRSLGSTGAFLMIPYTIFSEVGGFNEIYKECFEDVHLSIETILKGYKNYVVSTAVCYHKESQTRDVKKNASLIKKDLRENLLPYVIDNYDKLDTYIVKS